MARYLSKAELAAVIQRSPRTLDNWHSRGYITAFRSSDGTLLFDLDAVELAMRMRPFEMRDGRKRGAHGSIVPLPVSAVSE